MAYNSLPLNNKPNTETNSLFAPLNIDLPDSGGVTAVDWADVTGKPATFTPTIGATATTALAGNTPLLKVGTGAGDAMAGNTAIPTLPATATAAELEAGTVTATRLVSPKLIHDEIARQIAAISV